MHSVSLTDDETAFMWLFIPAVKVPLDKSGNYARGGVSNLEKCSFLIRCIWWRVFDMIEGQSWCEGGRSSLVNDAATDHLKHLILLGLLVEHTAEPAGVGGWQLLHLHWLQLISVCYVKQMAGPDAGQRGKGGWPEGIDLFLVIGSQ